MREVYFDMREARRPAEDASLQPPFAQRLVRGRSFYRPLKPQSDLNAVLAVKLANHCANEILNALLFERHGLGDLLIRETFGDQAGNLILTVRELEALRHHPRASAASDHGSCQSGAKRLRLFHQHLG